MIASEQLTTALPTVSAPGGHPLEILVVVQDPTLRHRIVSYLREQDIRATSVSGPREMLHHLADSEPSLVILDLQPGLDNGLDLLREIRSQSGTPVIITADQDCREIDPVAGLEIGADDYLAKPFSLRELLARIRAVLRSRRAGRLAARHRQQNGPSRFGGWQLNRRIRGLTSPDGVHVALTRSEYALLIAFLNAPQRPLTREYLLETTGMHEETSDRSVDVQILRLRRKLEADPAAPRIIRTEHGFGYVFDLPVE